MGAVAVRQLNVFCEGQTEQGFCRQVLQPHLFPRGDGIVHSLAVGQRGPRHLYGLGDRNSYRRIRKFIANTIKHKQGPDVYFTTLFDLYALPADFPGRGDHTRNPADPTPSVLALQEAFEADVGHQHFLAYLQLHEYETMLFAAPEAFAYSFEDRDRQVGELKSIVAAVPSIEHIDDGRETAPSKRIIAVFPGYAGLKATAGPDIAEGIGVQTIRAACPHFDRWVGRLERIAWQVGPIIAPA